MNRKITLPKAARLMAAKTGCPIKQCEDFLKTLANALMASLSMGEQVKVKGLGTFRVTTVEERASVDVSSGEPNKIAEHRKVVFVPCKEMASEVNAPFEFFTAVEIDDSVSEEELEQADDFVTENFDTSFEEDPEAEDQESIGESDVEAAEENTLDNSEVSVLQSPEERADVNHSTEEQNGSGEDNPEITIVKEDDEDMHKKEELKTDGEVQNESDNTHRPLKERKGYEYRRAESSLDEEDYRRDRFGRGFIIGFAVCLGIIALGIGIGFAFIWSKSNHIFDTGIENIVELVEEVEINDDSSLSIVSHSETETHVSSVSQESSTKESAVSSGASTEPSDKKADKPVYDTISKTRYLTTMAKEHYGDFNLWPYIYEENKAILGHPDRIRPGTKVVIPPLSKYGVTNSPENIAKAKKLGVEIYARFK